MEGSVTILSLVAKLSKKVIPPPQKKQILLTALFVKPWFCRTKKKIHLCTLSVSCKNKV